MKSITVMRGNIIRNSETPEHFSAINSLDSDIFPNAIMEDSKIASGNARGTKEAEAKNRSFTMVKGSNPFPTISSIYFHRNWTKSVNNTTKKVAINGPKKEKVVRVKIFFIQHLWVMSPKTMQK